MNEYGLIGCRKSRTNEIKERVGAWAEERRCLDEKRDEEETEIYRYCER